MGASQLGSYLRSLLECQKQKKKKKKKFATLMGPIHFGAYLTFLKQKQKQKKKKQKKKTKNKQRKKHF